MCPPDASNVDTSSPSPGGEPTPQGTAPPPLPPTPDDIPQQDPPPPHVVVVIAQLATDNLEGAFRRIAEDIQSFIDQSSIANKYNFLFLYDEQSPISERVSNKLYAEASSDFRDRSKPVFLLLHTKGGSPVPAYLISRYLKTSSTHGFVVSVPRRAKSAGTLLALGADPGLRSQDDYTALDMAASLDCLQLLRHA